MKVQEFEQHYNKLKQRIDDLMISKAGEYANDFDRLFNFKQPTSLLNTNPARVALYYCSKHYCSLAKITEDMDNGIYPSEDLILEKCGDIISYSYLIYACVLEEIYKHSPVASQNALQGTSKTEDDKDTVLAFLDKNFSEKEDSLIFDNTREEDLLKYHPEKSPMLDNNDSITKSPKITCSDSDTIDRFNLRTIL